MSKLIVISGPSGAGKGTVVKELLNIYKENNQNVYLSVSNTTREIREGEIDGVNYDFVSLEEFQKKIANHEFLEYNQYGTGKYYGTLKKRVLEYLAKGYDVILEIDINGYKQVLENMKEAIGIFIMPPSIEALESRLIKRNTETKEQINKRLETAKIEIMNKDIYPYVIVNQEGMALEAAKEIYKIIKEN